VNARSYRTWINQARGDRRVRDRAYSNALCRWCGQSDERLLHVLDGIYVHRSGAQTARRGAFCNRRNREKLTKAQLLTVPEAERLASGRQFMSPENQSLLREQAAKSHAEEYPPTISSSPAPPTTLTSA
jgi:hypothetical protein